MVRSPSFNVALTFILILYLQILEAKTKRVRCPIGFEVAYSKYDDDPICYQIKGPETFADKFQDCAGNLFTNNLLKRLSLTKPNVSVWTDYKSLYAGGLFVDWSYTDSMGDILDTTYEVNRNLLSMDEELCVIMDPITNFTAARCDDKHFRYCFIKEYPDHLDSDSSCDALKNGKRFWSPLPTCLAPAKGERGGNIRPTWKQAQEYCSKKGGSLLTRGWRYSNNPEIASVTAFPDYPLGFEMTDKNLLLQYNSSEIVPSRDWHFADTFDNSNSLGAMTNDFWYLVNSSHVFNHAICELPVYLRRVELKVSVNEENKIILTVSDDTLNKDKIHCFTDSSSYYPQKVEITKDSTTYILKPKEDGNYWCTHSDSKNFYISESNKVHYIKVKQATLNIYATKIRFYEKYSLDRIGKLLEYGWKKKIEEYVYFSTKYFELFENTETYDNYTIMQFRQNHSALGAKDKDVIQKIKLKRLFLDARTALLHVVLFPDMKPAWPGQWENMFVEFMRPVYYCNDTIEPRLVLNDITKASDCREYRCTGSFNEGVQLIVTLQDECSTTTAAVNTSVLFGKDPLPVSTADPLPSVAPHSTKSHFTELESSSSEEDFTGVLATPNIMARQVDANINVNSNITPETPTDSQNSTVNITVNGNSTVDGNNTNDGSSTADGSTTVSVNSTTDNGNNTESTTGPTTYLTKDPTDSTPQETGGSILDESGDSDSGESTGSSPGITQDTDGAFSSYPLPTRPPPTELPPPPSTTPTASPVIPTDPPPPPLQKVPGICLWPPCTVAPLPTVPPPSTAYPVFPSTAMPILPTTEETLTETWVWPPWTSRRPFPPTISPPSTATPVFPNTTVPIPSTTENPQEQLDQVIASLETLLENEIFFVDEINSTFTKVDGLLSDNEELEIPGNLLHLLDKVGARLNLNGADNVTTVKDNVALVVADATPTAPVRGLRIAVRNSDIFSEDAFNIIREQINSSHLSSDESEVVVSLPESISIRDHRVSFVVFRNDRAFQANQRLYSVNSRVLSVNVENVTHFEDNEVIDIHLTPLNRNVSEVNQTRSCAYWHFLNDSSGSGYWSQEGCTFIRATEEGSLDTCRCNHLTHFAEVLVPKTNFSEGNELALEIISIVGHCLSILGILMVGLTAAMFRSWRRDFSNKIWLQLCCAILLLSVGFLTVTFARFTEYSVGCMIAGVLVHYATLASFCWMVVAGAVSYRRLVKVFARDGTHKLLRAAVFAWGTPAGIVGVLLAASPLAYSSRMDERDEIHTISFCYPTGLALWLAVYAPIAVMIVINWTLFILIVRSVFASRRIQRHGDSNEALRCASVSCLLVFLFGLPWIFGLFAMNIVAAYLFTILAGFQGFVLFLFFVCGNKKTRDLWLNKLKIKQTRKVPVTSSTYTNRSIGVGPGGHAPGGLGGSRTGLNGSKPASLEEKESRPRSLNGLDDSRFS